MLAATNWKTVKETFYEVAILPWGATEAHNYHLPYATDNIQVDYVAAESARQAWEQGAKVIVLPAVPFGVNTGQLDIRLDINMNPSTQFAVLRDVVDALSRQGIPKLLVMNGHGGNDFRQMLRELQAAYPGIFLCAMNWFDASKWGDYFEESGDHAGEMETSVMQHIAPELVLPLSDAGTGRARQFKVRGLRERMVWAQRQWTQVTEDTGIGDPSKSTPEKGRRFLESVTQAIAAFLIDLAAADPHNLYADLPDLK